MNLEPSEHHLKLWRLVGSWRGKETIHPSQWEPDGGQAVVSSNTKPALDGFAVITEHERKQDGVIIGAGHGVWTYDHHLSQVLLHWFENSSKPTEVFRGNWDGDTLIVAHGGPGMHVRMQYDLTDELNLKTQVERSFEGRKWNLYLSSRFELK